MLGYMWGDMLWVFWDGRDVGEYVVGMLGYRLNNKRS